MIRQVSSLDDPVVAEVRKVREKLWREGGGTFEGLLHLLDEKFPQRRRRTKRITKRRSSR